MRSMLPKKYATVQHADLASSAALDQPVKASGCSSCGTLGSGAGPDSRLREDRDRANPMERG